LESCILSKVRHISNSLQYNAIVAFKNHFAA
jgi:hypothetical protein